MSKTRRETEVRVKELVWVPRASWLVSPKGTEEAVYRQRAEDVREVARGEVAVETDVQLLLFTLDSEVNEIERDLTLMLRERIGNITARRVEKLRESLPETIRLWWKRPGRTHLSSEDLDAWFGKIK